MVYYVTGGAGFIGSNVVRGLNALGHTDITIVDHLTSSGKWKNLVGLTYSNYLDRQDFFDYLTDTNPKIDVIIHLGACSATTENDENYLMHNNALYTKKLMEWCAEHNTRLIYASSAATYGNGDNGYDDTVKSLAPLNCYGYSKHLADQWMLMSDNKPPQWVGLKFFNVYGPYEEHKGGMASVIFHGYHQIKKTGKMALFKSYKPEYKDGKQLRDFIYVDDVVSVITFFIDNPQTSGIFNVGTGQARSFYDLAAGLFTALNHKPNIEFIEMPETLRNKYQYFTEAKIDRLRQAGYTIPFTELEKGIKHYVTYLEQTL